MGKYIRDEISKKIACFVIGGTLLIVGCHFNERETDKSNKMSKPYKEHRIAFLALDASCYDSWSSGKIKLDTFLYELKAKINTVIPTERGAYAEWQQSYENNIHGNEIIQATIKDLKNRINSLADKGQSKYSVDDFEFLALHYIYLNCAVYFTESWYELPDINFSSDLYEVYFSSIKELIFNHYQYDNDSANDNHLPIATKYPGNYEYDAPPHIIDTKTAKRMMDLLKAKKEDSTSELLAREKRFMSEMLTSVIDGKNVLIIKVYP